MSIVIYRIDSHDHLVYADGGLDGFAHAAGVPRLPAQWVGKSLWGCIDDDEMRAVLVALVARARSGRTLAFNTRCEPPSVAHTVAMEIAPLADGGVEFRCAPAAGALRTPRPVRSFDLLRVCAWCYRARSEGIWRDIEDVVAGEHLLERATLPIVTHGICDACLVETDAELDALATRPSAASPH
jgi:hypothetical protein